MKRLVVWTLAGALAPSLAWAGNESHPRTPVEWPADVPCMTTVDRSVDPVLHLDYGIPMEDTMPTPDEVDQSRTHQFFAFCRDSHLNEFHPNFVKMSEAEEAAENGLGVIEDVGPEDVLELSTIWADCWHRINLDEDRRPITFAAAEEGVDWDTSGVPAGTYEIEGFTFEPWVSRYWRRKGVVRVVDGPGADVGPAAAVMNGNEEMYRNDTLTLDACIQAGEGSTMTAYWAIQVEIGEPLTWEPFVIDEPVQNGAQEIPFPAPEGVAESMVDVLLIRVDVTDAQERTYTAFMDAAVSVFPGDNPDTCPEDEGGSLVGNPDCDDTGGDGDGDGDSGSTGGTGPDQEGESGGCGCTSTSDSPGGLALGLLGLVAWQRRRRTRSLVEAGKPE